MRQSQTQSNKASLTDFLLDTDIHLIFQSAGAELMGRSTLEDYAGTALVSQKPLIPAINQHAGLKT